MRFQEIAKAFGMTVGQFAEAIGYKRPTLYLGIRKTARAKEAINKLHELNSVLRKVDIEKANQNYERRKDAVKNFEALLLNGGEAI